MNVARELARAGLARATEALRAFHDDPERLDAFARACGVVSAAIATGGRLYSAGNGGSAADALHVVAELVGRIGSERAPLPAEALVADPVTLSALANDYGYEHLFARQLQAKLRPGDALLALTTSGRSPNLLRALEVCRDRGVPSVLFAGRDPGPAGALADCVVAATDDDPKTVQELHRVLAHALCLAVERGVAGGD